MFKRVEKRQRKLEEEEELGLTEEMKEVMGMHDTDSDESDSGEEGNSSDQEEGGDGLDASGEEDYLEGVEEVDEEVDEEAEEEIDEEDEEVMERPPLSVTEAMADPLYTLTSKGFLKVCAVCPAKRLKDTKMEEEHRNSKVRSKSRSA